LLLGTERSLFLLRRPLASCAGPLWIRHVHHPRSGNCRIGESLTFPARDGARCVCVRRSWVRVCVLSPASVGREFLSGV
jgi:hypothetical protein